MENSSAMKNAISSPASGLPESGLKSMSRVSKTRRMVSTSPVPSSVLRPASSLLPLFSPKPSRRRVAMSSRKEPDATEAGYCFAKLRRPNIAARRSSKSVADCRRPHRVSIVAVAVCNGGVLSIVGVARCPEAGLACYYIIPSTVLRRTFLQLQKPIDEGDESAKARRWLWSTGTDHKAGLDQINVAELGLDAARGFTFTPTRVKPITPKTTPVPSLRYSVPVPPRYQVYQPELTSPFSGYQVSGGSLQPV